MFLLLRFCYYVFVTTFLSLRFCHYVSTSHIVRFQHGSYRSNFRLGRQESHAIAATIRITTNCKEGNIRARLPKCGRHIDIINRCSPAQYELTIHLFAVGHGCLQRKCGIITILISRKNGRPLGCGLAQDILRFYELYVVILRHGIVYPLRRIHIPQKKTLCVRVHN